MANEQIKQKFKDIANAIRAKTGENGTMTAEEMPAKIEAIETGITPTGTLDITANGDGIDVTTYAAVDVNVPGPSGSINIISNGRNIDVSGYEYANVQLEADSVDSTHFDWDSDLLGYKIFGLDETSDGSSTNCIDAEMIDNDGYKTFSCNLFGKVAAFHVSSSGGEMMLSEDSDWFYKSSSDDYYVMCSCVMGKCNTKEIRSTGLALDVDESLSGDEVISWLHDNYSNHRIVFTDLLGNILYEVHLYDLVSGGGS